MAYKIYLRQDEYDLIPDSKKAEFVQCVRWVVEVYNPLSGTSDLTFFADGDNAWRSYEVTKKQFADAYGEVNLFQGTFYKRLDNAYVRI